MFNIIIINLSLLLISLVSIIDLLIDTLLHKRLFEFIFYILFFNIALIALKSQLTFNNKDERFNRITIVK